MLMPNEGQTTQTQAKLPRIAIISSERYPHHDTNTQQIIKNASAFHFAGLPVSLWIPLQYGSLSKGKVWLRQAIYKYYNVQPGLGIRILSHVPASNLRLEKFFHSLLATVLAAFDTSVELIYTRNRFVALLALLFRKPFVFETYRRLGDEHPGAMRLLSLQAKSRVFTGMVLHSQVAADSMLRAGIPEEKLLVLHNGVDNSDMLPRLGKSAARQALGLDPGMPYVVYTGNMQPNKCIESIIDIAALSPQARFLLVGGRPEDMERLRAYSQALRADNVDLVERRPIAEVSKYLYAADVLMIPPVSAPLEKFGKTVLPFKLFPYLAAGRPIIAPDQPDMRELLVNGENGLLVPSDDAAGNSVILGNLLENKALQEQLSAKALDTSEGLTWESRALKFKNWLAKRWSRA